MFLHCFYRCFPALKDEMLQLHRLTRVDTQRRGMNQAYSFGSN